jgi:hypothetical protein
LTRRATPPALNEVPIPIAVIAAAAASRRLLALRAWALARAVDPAGQGRLPQAELARRLQALGFRRDHAYRLIGELARAGFGRRAAGRRTGQPVIVLASIDTLREMLDADKSRHRVHVPVADLVLPAYKRLLSAAASARHNGRPIARATKQRLYGSSPRSQLRAERDLGATVQVNVAVYDVQPGVDPTQLPAVDGGRTFFRRCTPRSIYVRQPNSTTIPRRVTRGPQRRYSPAQTAMGEPTSPRIDRRHCDTPDQARRAAGRERNRNPNPAYGAWRADQEDRAPRETFVRDQGIRLKGKPAQTWRAR